MPTAWMSPDGVFRENCEDGTPPRDPSWVLAPADEGGFYGMQGFRWDGKAWVEHVEQDPKLAGVEFEGVMCSATKEDQDGLAAVLLAIQFQGPAFQPTRFYFANGETLVLHLGNFQAFAATWLPFRQSFFLAG